MENALRLNVAAETVSDVVGLNPYFFGKCSTALIAGGAQPGVNSLNPYFFGKCSTASNDALALSCYRSVLILIFLENALRQSLKCMRRTHLSGLNPYFFGKCSTAPR